MPHYRSGQMRPIPRESRETHTPEPGDGSALRAGMRSFMRGLRDWNEAESKPRMSVDVTEENKHHFEARIQYFVQRWHDKSKNWIGLVPGAEIPWKGLLVFPPKAKRGQTAKREIHVYNAGILIEATSLKASIAVESLPMMPSTDQLLITDISELPKFAHVESSDQWIYQGQHRGSRTDMINGGHHLVPEHTVWTLENAWDIRSPITIFFHVAPHAVHQPLRNTKLPKYIDERPASPPPYQLSESQRHDDIFGRRVEEHHSGSIGDILAQATPSSRSTRHSSSLGYPAPSHPRRSGEPSRPLDPAQVSSTTPTHRVRSSSAFSTAASPSAPAPAAAEERQDWRRLADAPGPDSGHEGLYPDRPGSSASQRFAAFKAGRPEETLDEQRAREVEERRRPPQYEALPNRFSKQVEIPEDGSDLAFVSALEKQPEVLHLLRERIKKFLWTQAGYDRQNFRGKQVMPVDVSFGALTYDQAVVSRSAPLKPDEVTHSREWTPILNCFVPGIWRAFRADREQICGEQERLKTHVVWRRGFLLPGEELELSPQVRHLPVTVFVDNIKKPNGHSYSWFQGKQDTWRFTARSRFFDTPATATLGTYRTAKTTWALQIMGKNGRQHMVVVNFLRLNPFLPGARHTEDNRLIAFTMGKGTRETRSRHARREGEAAF